jgi:RNA polymerase sigma factor (sigma-70 family)
MVQELYIWLWTRRENLSHVTALKSYLYNAIRYKVVNYFEHHAVQQRYIENYVLFEASHDNSNEELSDISDIGPMIEKSIAVLPERCQMAFRLSRLEHMPISNIAAHMNISSRTVENYITHALKHLRLTWRNLYGAE